MPYSRELNKADIDRIVSGCQGPIRMDKSTKGPDVLLVVTVVSVRVIIRSDIPSVEA